MTATIVGATGLIGNYLLEELLADNYFDTVCILIRRPLAITHPKLEKKQVPLFIQPDDKPGNSQLNNNANHTGNMR